VRFAPEGLLIEQALTRLERAPTSSVDLAQEVMGIQGGLPAIADRLITALLRDQPRVSRDLSGDWCLDRREAPTVTEVGQRLDQMRFAVVDVETTGGVAGSSGRIIEIAIVHVDFGAITDTYSTLVDAEVSIPPWIARLTGIQTEMVRGAPRFAEICDEVRARLAGRVFVAHSAGFDWGFVRSEMRRAGAVVPRGPRLCTVHFARRLLPGLQRRGLDALTRYYGVEIQGRHRAKGDAVATAQVLVRMLADAERRGWTTWPELKRALGPKPKKRKRGGDGGKGAKNAGR